jgi:translation initiation factor 2 beta subunit (eIF-2beta)/eIF-5
LFEIIGKLENDENHMLKKALIERLLENSSTRYVPVLAALMSSPLGKFATHEHLKEFGEKADLEQCYTEDLEHLFETIGKLEENENHILKKAFIDGLLENDLYLNASVLTALMSSPLGKFATHEHLKEFGEKAHLKQYDTEDLEYLFETTGKLEENENHMLKKAFIDGLLENDLDLNAFELTVLISSSLGKFATNEHLEKFGEKADLCSLSHVDMLFAAFGSGEEAKERKRAFLKGVESNSQTDSEWKEHMNKLIEEVE